MSAGGFGLDRRRVGPAPWVSRPTPGGSPAFSGESRRKERRGRCPLDPLFYGPLARFGVVGRSGAVVGRLRGPCTCPDLGRFFVEGCTTQRLPLGGKLSPKVTDEGATGLPNGAGEETRWGDGRESPLFYKERLGTGSPPHPTRLCRPTFPPRGRL